MLCWTTSPFGRILTTPFHTQHPQIHGLMALWWPHVMKKVGCFSMGILTETHKTAGNQWCGQKHLFKDRYNSTFYYPILLRSEKLFFFKWIFVFLIFMEYIRMFTKKGTIVHVIHTPSSIQQPQIIELSWLNYSSENNGWKKRKNMFQTFILGFQPLVFWGVGKFARAELIWRAPPGGSAHYIIQKFILAWYNCWNIEIGTRPANILYCKPMHVTSLPFK